MKTDATEHKTNGRKIANAALITLFRVGVIASIMMLVLGAGMVAGATWTVNDGDDADFTTIPVATDAASGADEIEISYDDGNAEGSWSMGYNPLLWSPDSDGGKNGYALRMTTPNSEPFTISAIKVFSMRYGEDCKTRFEIWDHDKNTLYSDIVLHSEYSILGPWDCDVGDYATWGYKDVPDVAVSGDFYIVMYTDSTNPEDDIDVSRDGKVTSLDALMLLQAAAGAIGP
ncbi:MAG: hypothetical protein U9Q68_06735 [Euryarchaeota archaeon]|nr:hypothetical protein [Euryarchaeota archaeon]